MDYIVDSQGVKYKCHCLSKGLIAEVYKLEPTHSRNITIPKSVRVNNPHYGENYLREGDYQIKSINQWAFSDDNFIESVILPEGLKEIEINAFENCSSLVSVKIPNSVVKIGSEAFCECKNLRSIVLPDNLEWISEDLFHGCTNLEYVKIGDYTKEIDKTAFRNCPNLKEVVFRWHKGRENLVEFHRELREAVPSLAIINDVHDDDNGEESTYSKTKNNSTQEKDKKRTTEDITNQVEEYIFCPKCGRKILADKIICPHCYVKVRNYKVKPYDSNKRKHQSCGCVVFIILLLLAGASGGFILFFGDMI